MANASEGNTMTKHKSDRRELVSRTALPPAAQRWLERALPEDLALPSQVRLEQAGQMELRGRWTPFTAHGISEAHPLSFSWQARFPLFPGVWIIPKDGHLGGQGWGSALLWGIISMGKRTGPQVLASQLVRNLGELAWLPSLVLADQLSPGRRQVTLPSKFAAVPVTT